MSISPDRKEPKNFFSKDCIQILFQVASLLGAGLFLFASQINTICLIPSVLLLGISVFLGFHSRHRLFSLLSISFITSLILSLRFDFLTWGDPWYEYEMIQRIITYQTLDPSIYTAQFPVLHGLIATGSLLTGIEPLTLQKFIIPSISVVAVYAVYKLTNEISSSDTAFYAGLLLISGTPYLHWITQGVRESLGLALAILTLYVCIRAIRRESTGYLVLSFLLIGGITLTHHLSMGIFLLSWLVISLTLVYLVCDKARMQKTVIFSLIITTSSAVCMTVWWSAKNGYVFSQFSGLLNSIFHSDFGIPLFLICLIIIYLIPLLAPEKIHLLQTHTICILKRKRELYGICIFGLGIGGIVVLNYLSGRSGFSPSYPASMLFNGICIVFFTFIGLYYFFDKNRLPILGWGAVLSLALILSLSNIIQIEDSIRFIEFLYVPLSIISAFGITRIAELIGPTRFFPGIMTVFIMISIVLAFPSIVFFGQVFEPGHPLYDNRSWVISHTPSETSAISWLGTSRASGIIDTDAYVGYAARGILLSDNLSVQSGYPFMREQGYPQRGEPDDQQHYLLILSRMNEYIEFGIQWLKEKEPLNERDLRQINSECNFLYSNGDAKIESYFSNVTSEYYYYNIKG